MLPVCLLLLSATSAADPAVPSMRTQRGYEWTYRGTISEAMDRPTLRFRRRHTLEVKVLVLDRKDRYSDLAILTLLHREDDAVSEALPAVSGAAERNTAPPAARLDLVRLFDDGTRLGLLPPSTLPLVLDDRTPTAPLPAAPIDAFAAFEFGVLPPNRNLSPVTDASRTPQWVEKAEDFVSGEKCRPIVFTQQTGTWAQPRGGQTASLHHETVWLSTRDGTVRQVHRLLQQRDGFKPDPSLTIEVKFELDDRTQVLGREFDRYRREIEVAYAYAAELAVLLPSASRLDPRLFESRVIRLDDFLRANRPGTPYREAVLAVRRRFDAARRGEAAPTAFLPPKHGPGVTASPIAPPVARATAGP